MYIGSNTQIWLNVTSYLIHRASYTVYIQCEVCSISSFYEYSFRWWPVSRQNTLESGINHQKPIQCVCVCVCVCVCACVRAHTLTRSYNHLLTRSLAHTVTCSRTHSLIPSLAHTLTRSYHHLLKRSLAHTVTCSHTQSLIPSLAHTLTRSYHHLLTHSLAHTITCSHTHSLTQSPKMFIKQYGTWVEQIMNARMTITWREMKILDDYLLISVISLTSSLITQLQVNILLM